MDEPAVAMPVPVPYIPEEANGLVVAEWNRIFLAYCFSRGEGDPMQMIIRDSVLHPGDHMRGFLDWLPRQWTRFLDIVEPHWRGWDLEYRRTWRDHHAVAFSRWLWAQWARPEPRTRVLSQPEKESS